jgi:hypothetical protein
MKHLRHFLRKRGGMLLWLISAPFLLTDCGILWKDEQVGDETPAQGKLRAIVSPSSDTIVAVAGADYFKPVSLSLKCDCPDPPSSYETLDPQWKFESLDPALSAEVANKDLKSTTATIRFNSGAFFAMQGADWIFGGGSRTLSIEFMPTVVPMILERVPAVFQLTVTTTNSADDRTISGTPRLGSNYKNVAFHCPPDQTSGTTTRSIVVLYWGEPTTATVAISGDTQNRFSIDSPQLELSGAVRKGLTISWLVDPEWYAHYSCTVTITTANGVSLPIAVDAYGY